MIKFSTFLSFLLFLCLAVSAQKVPVYGDSILVTSRTGSAELILQNSTKDSTGFFLMNTGKGRTSFKRPMKKINDSVYLIGPDTLKIHSNPGASMDYNYVNTQVAGKADSGDLKRKVDTTRKVNGKRLSSDIVIMQGDVPNLTDSLAGKVPSYRRITIGKNATPLDMVVDRIFFDQVPNVDATNPSNIGQDASHRWATDTEKTNWNGKATTDTTGALRNDLETIKSAKLDSAKQSRYTTYAGLRSMSTPQFGVPYTAGNLTWYLDATGTDDSAMCLKNASTGNYFKAQTDNVTLDLSWRTDGTPDGKIITDASMTAGSVTLVSATANFTSADIGKVIFVTNAKTGKICLPSSIVAVNNSTSVTLANAANLSVSGDSVVFGTDNTKAFEWINRTARKYGTATIVFKKGIYLTQYNNWMAGVKNAVVNGNSASIMCTLGAYNPSTFTSTLQAFGMPTVFDEVDNRYGTTNYGSNYGYLFHTTTPNTDSIVLINAADAANFSVGNWTMPGGFEGENNGGYPPLYKFWEWAKIISINYTTGVIKFDKTLTNTYDEGWPDSTWAGGTAGHGAPRLLNCNRANFNIVESLRMNDLNFSPFPGWQNVNAAANRNGRISFFGILNSTFDNVTMQAAYIGSFKDMVWNKCKVVNYFEPDKEGTNFTANGGSINGIALGNLYSMTFNNGLFTGIHNINARYVTANNCIVNTIGLGSTTAIAGWGGGNSRVEYVKLTGNQYVISDSSRTTMIGMGGAAGVRTLTVGTVTNSTTFTMTNAAYAAAQGSRAAYPGCSGKTSTGKTITITRIFDNKNGTLSVQGVFSSPPVASDAFNFNTVGTLEINGEKAIGKYAYMASMLSDTVSLDNLLWDSANGFAQRRVRVATMAQAINVSNPNAVITVLQADSLFKNRTNISIGNVAANPNSPTPTLKGVPPKNIILTANGLYAAKNSTQILSGVLIANATFTTTQTGAIKITLPAAYNTIASTVTLRGIVTVAGIDSSFEFFISSNLTTGGWNTGVATTAKISSAINRPFNVRYASDASNRYVYIGELSTQWYNGLSVVLYDMNMGAASTPNADSYMNGWILGFESSAFATTVALNKAAAIIAPSASTLFNRANNTITAATITDTLSTSVIKITGGSPGAGKVYTSDGNGVGTWQTPSTASGGLDAAQLTASGSTPSVSAANSTDVPTISVAGKDGVMRLTFTVASTAIINGTVCTITFNTARTGTPVPIIKPADILFPEVSATATTSAITVKASNLGGGTYTYYIHVLSF